VRRFPPVTMTAVQLPVGAAALLVALALAGDLTHLVGFSFGGWVAIVFLATIGGAISFYSWIWALERISPSRVAVTVSLNPVSAALLGAVLLGEPLTARLLLGLVGVVAGIALTNWPLREGAAAKAVG
jgi:drug/metabolite transporter (DMT)-like permease